MNFWRFLTGRCRCGSQTRAPFRLGNTPLARSRRHVRGGFSLLELLIVMVLIIVMFTFYFGGGSRSYQTRQMAKCEKNLENIYVALKTYSLDHNGQFPQLAGAATAEPALSLLVPRATTGTEVFICPGGKDKPLPEAQPFADRRISYAYYMGQTAAAGADDPLVSDRQVDTNSKTRGQPLFSADGKKPGNNHNKYRRQRDVWRRQRALQPGGGGIRLDERAGGGSAQPEALRMKVKVQCPCGTRFELKSNRSMNGCPCPSPAPPAARMPPAWPTRSSDSSWPPRARHPQPRLQPRPLPRRHPG